jgi:hypothetical protein
MVKQSIVDSDPKFSMVAYGRSQGRVDSDPVLGRTCTKNIQLHSVSLGDADSN